MRWKNIVVNVSTENGNLFVEEVCFCIIDVQICGKRYKKLETGRDHSGAASQAQKENERV